MNYVLDFGSFQMTLRCGFALPVRDCRRSVPQDLGSTLGYVRVNGVLPAGYSISTLSERPSTISLATTKSYIG